MCSEQPFLGRGWILGVFFRNVITPSLGSFQKYNLEKKKWSWRREKDLLDLSLPQMVALRRQACSTDRVPFLPSGALGLSIHPSVHPSIHASPARWPREATGRWGCGGQRRERPHRGRAWKRRRLCGLICCLHPGVSRSDELFQWQRRVAAWPFLVGPATYKSFLLAGPQSSCPPGTAGHIVPGEPMAGSCSGQPLPLGRAGTCPSRAGSSRFKAGRVSGSRQIRGCPWGLSIAWQSRSVFPP